MKEYIQRQNILGQAGPLGPIYLEWNAEEVWSGLELAGYGNWLGDMRSDYAYNGDYSLYMRTDTPTTQDQLMEAHFLLYPAPHGAIKFNIPFLFPAMDGSIYWNFSIQAIWAHPDHTATAFTLLYIWPLYWYAGTTQNGAMVWQYIPGSNQNLSKEVWHKLTLRSNYDTKKYIDFSCDTLNLDLSSIDPVSIWYTNGEYDKEYLVFLMSVYAYGNQAQPPTEMYFDQFSFYEE